MKKTVTFFVLSFLYMLAPLLSPAQKNYSESNFLHLHENQILNTENSTNFKYLMDKLSGLCLGKSQDINILQIGDSHIQAGFFSNELRPALQNYFTQDSSLSYGLLFPFAMAETNNPGNYSVTHTGRWQHCNSVKDTNCRAGIYPVMLKTGDSPANITIKLKGYYSKDFLFDRLQLFTDSLKGYQLKVNSRPLTENEASSGKKISLNQHADSLRIELKKKPGSDTSIFRLCGLNLYNSSVPLQYHAVGTNGATVETYLNNPLFFKQLEIVQPQMIILSLGTNEAYNQNLDPEVFEKNLVKLISEIRHNTKNTWLLLDIPGDARWKGQYINKNNRVVRNILIETAKEMHCSYWDFYEIMGGENSIDAWYNHDLAAEDKLHLAPEGYRLKADLFFDAFKKLFEGQFNTYITERE